MENQTLNSPDASSQTLSVNPVVRELLKRRGYESDQEIKRFFSWNLHQTEDLTKLLDLDKATERIIVAIESGEKIGIYGDYDVDGTTSCALLYHFFKSLDTEVELFQPSRFVEGYGVHPVSIDQAIKKGVKLLITVDCGISNLETAEYTHDKDIDLIISDHHKDAKEYIPKAYAVINPNRRDETTPDEMKHLAGVGVAFALALSIKKALEAQGKEIPSLYPLLQLVAIGTICDLAQLSHTNRILTRHGLKQLPKTTIPGLQNFLKPEDTVKDFLESEKCSFLIGPNINSRGRLDHPEVSLQLLIEPDPVKAQKHYFTISNSNQERKAIQKEVVEQAVEDIKKIWTEPNPLINIVYRPDWHEGVIGIVASRLVETFKIPAIVFTNTDNPEMIKASARTAGELDLFKALDHCKDLFEKFGGHKAAAGLSMKKENLSVLKERLHRYLETIPEILRTKPEPFDLEVSLNDMNFDLAEALHYMEPFGNGNPTPIFRIKDAYLTSYSLLKEIHVRWNFSSKTKLNNFYKSLNGISFNYINKWGSLDPEKLYHIQDQNPLIVDATLNINHFNGKKYLQLMVQQIKPQFQIS